MENQIQTIKRIVGLIEIRGKINARSSPMPFAMEVLGRASLI